MITRVVTVALAATLVSFTGAASAADSFSEISPAGYDVATSFDGRFVAIGGAPEKQVNWLDVLAPPEILVSRASGADGAPGNAPSVNPSISGDGRYVSFTSDATNLAPDSNGVNDVYLRDTATGTTALVSQAVDGAQGDRGSELSSISQDGNVVAFLSHATNLVPGGVPPATSPTMDQRVFAKDLRTGTVYGVSRESGADGAWMQDCFVPDLSSDGRLVAFSCFTGEMPTGSVLVYARDLVTHTTELVSRLDGPTGAPLDGISGRPAMSADGRWVAFEFYPRDFNAQPSVYLRDRLQGTTKLLSAPTGRGYRPAISDDGRTIAYLAGSRIGVVDRDTGATRVLQAPNEVLQESISGDGRFVTFVAARDSKFRVFRADLTSTDPPATTKPPATESPASTQPLGFTLARPPVIRRDGTATLDVNVPAAGSVSVGPRGPRWRGLIFPVVKTVTQPGRITVRVRPTPAGKRILRRRHVLPLRLTVRFKPPGPPPMTFTVDLKLRKG